MPIWPASPDAVENSAAANASPKPTRASRNFTHTSPKEESAAAPLGQQFPSWTLFTELRYPEPIFAA